MNNYLETLNKLLSNIVVMNVLMNNLHWNVTDKRFSELHEVTGELYTQFQKMTDEVAERIKMLGAFPYTTLEEYSRNTIIDQLPSKNYNANEVITYTLKNINALLQFIYKLIEMSKEYNDYVTEALLIDYASYLGKQYWLISQSK